MAVKRVDHFWPDMVVVEVESEGTTSIDLLDIPADTLIERVLVRIKTAATGTANLIVGDDDDDNGFIVAADATAAAATVYGDAIAEVGAYLMQASGATSGYCPNDKLYTATGKEVKFVLSAAPTTEGVYQVIIKLHRFQLNPV